MSLVINHNLIAMSASKSLSRTYSSLAKATQRLSSGLRINSAKDDAAGLAIRELMRSDLMIQDQGYRNAQDGISMIQTAEGAMAVIDEKLVRMKELAEQAATGTYTTLQRDIMNSEFQQMAAEIDRIALSTEFNGIKLLDGSISSFHTGSGLKVHFGSHNSSAEDYYLVNIGDVRATSRNGLHVGGDSKVDVHRQSAGSGRGVLGLDSAIINTAASAGAFTYYFNYSGDTGVSSADLQTESYLAGLYFQQSGSSLQDLISSINRGSASRVQINFGQDQISALGLGTGGHLNIVLGDEVYQFGSGAGSQALYEGQPPTRFIDINGRGGETISSALAAEITSYTSGNLYALYSSSRVFVYFKNGGDNNSITACDCGSILSAENNVTWTNMETWVNDDDGSYFSLGGQTWGRAGYVVEDDLYYLNLTGGLPGVNHDLIVGDASAISTFNTIPHFGFSDFQETQNASDGDWAAAQIRTQSYAQEALDAIDLAIARKEKIRATLGALQNRMENTLTAMGIQMENLQASESRISDVDVAKETTEFSRQNILAQTAAAMLAQANTLPQLALTLLG